MAEISDIALNNLPESLQAANLKLHLVVTAETARVFSEFGVTARDLLLGSADEDGTLGAISGFAVAREIETAWGETFGEWVGMFEKGRWVAGALAFGGAARQHQAMMGGLDEGRGTRDAGRLDEQTVGTDSPVFEPQLQAVLDAARQRVLGDGWALDGRIWRLDRESKEQIQRTVLDGIASGDSAWDIAKRLEGNLGAGNECPRWTSTRLQKLTPTDRMTSKSGLVVSVLGTPCEMKGVSYKALRLARNEIQYAHQRATDELWAKIPWIEDEQVVLSPDHPPIGCECEDVVAGGEDGDGVYPKGTISLPLHVQCMCYKDAILMDRNVFADMVRRWVMGQVWAAMDAYAAGLGFGVGDDKGQVLDPGLLVSWGVTLVTWLWGNQETLSGILGK